MGMQRGIENTCKVPIRKKSVYNKENNLLEIITKLNETSVYNKENNLLEIIEKLNENII